jgi:DNA-binding NarL/FixJ family response regulator
MSTSLATVSSDPIKVALVEDNADEREALFLLIKGTPGFTCLGTCSTAEEALKQLPLLRPDVVLMDMQLPGISGIDCVRQLKPSLPSARIMMLTVFEDHDHIFEALKAGANGYLVKKSPPAKLLEAIQLLHEGGAPMSSSIARQVVDWFHRPVERGSGRAPAHRNPRSDPSPDPHLEQLSPREDQVLALLSKGYLYKEIADQLDLSLSSVRTYIGRIYEKLHVHSRAEAMLKVLPHTPARIG